jgi:TatD DNase family protein
MQAAVKYYDAHNHLQDERFNGRQAELVAACVQAGVVRMVVNGSCEEDWPQVLALAQAHPQVLPSFGYHPWWVQERTAEWEQKLVRFLEQAPSAVGEIGLDRWKPGLTYAGQEEVFLAQMRMAADRDLPASIHCLQAWGRLLELLRDGPRPQRGFLLHSYGGGREMVASFAKLGACFGFPGFFLHPRKARQREVFKHVPLDRLLVETDAPDQRLPEMPVAAVPTDGQRNLDPWLEAQVGRVTPCAPQPGKPSPDGAHGVTRPTTPRGTLALTDPRTGQPINHPANLPLVYAGLAGLLGIPLEALAPQVEENFLRLFGSFPSHRSMTIVTS